MVWCAFRRRGGFFACACVRVLLRRYAEVFNTDGKGVDPRALMVASRNMHEKPLSLQEAEQMIAWLQKEGED